MKHKTSTNPAIGKRVVVRDALDNLPVGAVVPAGLTGVIRRVEHHDTDPWTRYTVEFDDGTIAEAQVMGQDIKIA